jgi:hypothetical protein
MSVAHAFRRFACEWSYQAARSCGRGRRRSLTDKVFAASSSVYFHSGNGAGTFPWIFITPGLETADAPIRWSHSPSRPLVIRF